MWRKPTRCPNKITPWASEIIECAQREALKSCTELRTAGRDESVRTKRNAKSFTAGGQSGNKLDISVLILRNSDEGPVGAVHGNALSLEQLNLIELFGLSVLGHTDVD